MTDKISLTQLANLSNENTAVTAINNNSNAITAAIDNTLSRDGTGPNQMESSIDMNSHRILNLPQPIDVNEPVTYGEFNSAVIGKGNIPIGGLTSQVLVKNSNADYDTKWVSEANNLVAGNNISITGTTAATINTVVNPSFTQVGYSGGTSGTTTVAAQGTASGTITLPSATDTLVGKATTDTLTNKTLDTAGSGNVLKINGTQVSAVTGTGSAVLATSPTITTPVISSIVNTGTLALPTSSDTLVGRATTDTLTNKTLDTAGAGNVLKINGTQVSAVTGTGSAVLATSPTLTTPTIGAATATTINGNTITTGTGTLTLGAGKTLANSNTLTLAGTDSTTITFQGTDTYVGRTTTDTLTNKTLTTPNINGAALSGTISGAPTLSGANFITNANRAQMAAFTIKGNSTGSTANEADISIPALTQKASPVAGDMVMLADSAASNALKFATVSSLASAGSVSSIAGNTGAFTLSNGIDNNVNVIELTAARRTLPTLQTFTSSSGTYTLPANCLWIEVEMAAAGGGGGGSGPNAGAETAGGAGGNTTFGTSFLTCNGGAGGGLGNGSLAGTGGAGGTSSGGDLNSTGQDGNDAPGANVSSLPSGGIGGNSPYIAGGGSMSATSGRVGKTNSGGGGGGAASVVSVAQAAGGGGGGGGLKKIVNTPSATYAYVVGAAGTAGAAGAGGNVGGAGAAGYIRVIEHYGT